MSHVLTLAVNAYDGLTTTLECTDPACPSRIGDTDCSVVEAFDWDQTASMEGYTGPTFDVSKFVIDVTQITDEGEFQWQMAGSEPSDSSTS